MILRPSLLSITALQVIFDYGWASSILFRGATIVGWDAERDTLAISRNASLLVKDDRIAEVFQQSQDISRFISTYIEIIDASDNIITPGFVDTHRHGWNAAWRTTASNNTMWEYFKQKFSGDATLVYEPEDVYIGQLIGLYESLNAGVTTSLNWAHNTWDKEAAEAGLKASMDSGARVFYGYVLHNTGSDFSLDQQVQHFRDLYASHNWESLPANLAVTSDLWVTGDVQPIVQLLKDLNISVITTHLVAGPYGFTNTPKVFHDLGILDTPTPVVFSHASFLGHENQQLLSATNQYISISPETEHSTSQTNPTAHLYLDQVSLGIDEFFTSSIDILTQARILLQHVRQLLFSHVHSLWQVPRNNPMSVNQAFLLATRSGGPALRRPDLGVIAPGAKADIVVWDGTSPALLGWVDPVAGVIQHASIADITHVLVDGVFKKRDGKLTVPDYVDTRARFLKSARRIQAAVVSAPKLEANEHDTWFTGAKAVDAPQVDVVRGQGTGYGPLWLSSQTGADEKESSERKYGRDEL